MRLPNGSPWRRSRRSACRSSRPRCRRRRRCRPRSRCGGGSAASRRSAGLRSACGTDALRSRCSVRAAHVFAGDRGQHRRRALHRGALQVVRDRAHAAQLFAAAGAARAAVLELRQRRCRGRWIRPPLRGRAPAGGRATRRSAAPRCAVRGSLRDQRADQAAAAACGERDRLVDASSYGISVLTGPKASTSCARVVIGCSRREQQRRREEGAVAAPSPMRREAVAPRRTRSRRPCGSSATRSATSLLLRVRGQRAHAHAFDRRVADHGLAPAARAASAATASRCLRGTMARRIAVHFWPALTGHLARHLLDEQLELLVVGRHVGRQDRAVQRVGLGVERDRVARTMLRCTRSLAAVSAEPVKVTTSCAVEAGPSRSPVRADHQLQRAFGQQARLRDQAAPAASVR